MNKSAISWRKAGVVAAAAAAVAAMLASHSYATNSGRNGLIAYINEVRGGGGHIQLVTIRPDGSRSTRILRQPGWAGGLDWSPDGSKIVFGVHDYPKYCAVEIMNADGSDLTDLTGEEHGCEGFPAFTADGRRIVFGRIPDMRHPMGSIWTMSLTGGDRRLVTTNGTHPKVSPDGKWITYVNFDTTQHYPALFAVRFDGSQRHQLTPYAWDVGGHKWSPDGKLIVLTTNADHARVDEPANLVTIRPDGSGMRPLTHFKDATTRAFAGSFSPDGKQVVFRLNKRRRYAIAVIDSDGRNLRLLTRLTASAGSRFADWGTHR